MSDPFAVPKEGITVQRSATVIIARRRPGPPIQVTYDSVGGDGNSAAKGLFERDRVRGGDGLIFESGWEVLMAQNEAVNWMRSTATAVKLMRYPAEWKFAGGNLESGESEEAAAVRELDEELLRPCGIDLRAAGGAAACTLIPMCCKQTRPIRGRSNLITNFVLLADEHPCTSSDAPPLFLLALTR